MKQLRELGENQEYFKSLGAEVIAVFREEQKGEEGLKLVKKKTDTKFTLALDFKNEQTGRYSAKTGEFTGYVIDSGGVIKAIFEGNLRNRAKSKAFLQAIKQASKSSAGSSKKGSDNKGGSKNR